MIFNYEHNLFVPRCHKIKNIEIIHKQDSCFKLFNVRFSYNKKFIDAFLLKNNLIIDSAEKTKFDRKFIYDQTTWLAIGTIWKWTKQFNG